MGAGHQPVGSHSRLPCFRPDPAVGRTVQPPARHHQRRLRCRFRRCAQDGRLQRQQGRCAVAVGDPGRRIVRQRSESHGAVPDLRQDEHRRVRPNPDQTTQFANKVMRWTGFSSEKVARICLDAHDRGELYCMPQLEAKIGWNIKRLVPGTYTRADRPGVPGRPALTAPIERRIPVAIDMEAMLAKIKDRQWALADIDWDAPGAEMITDEQSATAQGVHGRPVLDREHRRPRLRGAGEEGTQHRQSPRSTATSTPRSSATPTPNWR